MLSSMEMCSYRVRGTSVSTHRVVELLQAGDGEEVVDVDPVLNQQLDEVHPVQHQGVHHGLLQGVHLRGKQRQT